MSTILLRELGLNSALAGRGPDKPPGLNDCHSPRLKKTRRQYIFPAEGTAHESIQYINSLTFLLMRRKFRFPVTSLYITFGQHSFEINFG